MKTLNDLLEAATAPPKGGFTVYDVKASLDDHFQGHLDSRLIGEVPLSTLFRIINGLGIKKGFGGRYTKPDIVLIAAWVASQRRGEVYSYEQFMENTGVAVYNAACQLENN